MRLRHTRIAVAAASVGLVPVAVGTWVAHHVPPPAVRATQGHLSPAGTEPAIPPSSPTSTSTTAAPTSTSEAPTTSTSIEPTTSLEPALTVPARSTTVPDRPAIAGGTTSASWYGAESGARTADGERYDPEGLTFAHRSMPFGTAVRFCRDGACVVATCTDRGPAAWTGRDFDLSRATFGAIAPLSAGVATVSWERLG